MKMPNRSALLFFFHSTYDPSRSFLYRFSSLAKTKITDLNSNSNSSLVDCLTNTYKFNQTQALSISNRFSSVKSPDKPQSVHKYFRELGFSETQIRTVVLCSPRILYSYVNKTLKPKVEFFKKQLGVESSDLGTLISNNPSVLGRSLNKKLLPSIQFLKKIYGHDDEHIKDISRILGRCKWDLFTNPQRLLANCAILEGYGIAGPQLSKLLKRRPSIFLMQESKLRDLVSRVSDIGFSRGSAMFCHGIIAFSGMSNDGFKNKMESFGRFGFSESECMEIFRRTPNLIMTSRKKLEFGIDFFLNTVKLRRSMLIHSPWILMSSMEKRVIPRYKVFRALKLKKLFKRDPSFYQMLLHTESKFLEKFILMFKDDAEELLLAYKGHISDSSEEEEEGS